MATYNLSLKDSNRLRNIENTEKAKREMMEARKVGNTRRRPEDEDFAAARCTLETFSPADVQSFDRIRKRVRTFMRLKMQRGKLRDYRLCRNCSGWKEVDMRRRRMSRCMIGSRKGEFRRGTLAEMGRMKR